MYKINPDLKPTLKGLKYPTEKSGQLISTAAPLFLAHFTTLLSHLITIYKPILYIHDTYQSKIYLEYSEKIKPKI